MSNFLEYQNWRYATKKFDANKKISAADLTFLKEAMRLAASSYGLQPYKILFIETSELRAKLQPAAWGQSQVVDASHLIVFANFTNIGETEINHAVSNMEAQRNLPAGSMKGYADFIASKITSLTIEQKNTWTAKQTYIALANLLAAAAELKIDVTPMEGFEPEQFNSILGLDALHLNAAVVAAIGYRHQDDASQHYKKVRKSNDDLFINL